MNNILEFVVIMGLALTMVACALSLVFSGADFRGKSFKEKIAHLRALAARYS
ncbi:MAG: hypothetical protein O3C63_06185 [Cyanobacteria bacterium]|nr:hypothetical protein [Cyanobacteriota bacterium]MDA1020936.1 hypothetical protein [Cyanobacteriota bacterium]